MAEDPSDRLVDQRIRNRIIEAIEVLADGDEGVRGMGPNEYFEGFYDWVPHRDEDRRRFPNATIVPAEQAAIEEVSAILDDACDATPGTMSVEEFIGTGWPGRIQPVACRVLALLEGRGRFSEESEEDEPSGRR